MSSFLNLNKNIHVLAFFLIFFLIGIFIFSDYGISIDEDKTRLNGFISLEYIFKTFIPDQVAEINKMTAGAINTNFWDNINEEFSKDEMLTSESIANFILQAITTPDNAVVEEIVIRRTAGDMRF